MIAAVPGTIDSDQGERMSQAAARAPAMMKIEHPAKASQGDAHAIGTAESAKLAAAFDVWL